MPCHCSTSHPLDQFEIYCANMKRVYGKDVSLMTRERWDAACSEPRKARVLTDDDFDYNYFSEECGDGSIY
jgi:hypothetical protein